MSQDLITISYWWFLLFTFGIVGLPLTFSLFKNFFDSGYAFSKISTIMILTYASWLLGSLKILSFNELSLWLLFFAFVLVNFFLARHLKTTIFSLLKKSWRLILFEEILFIFCLFFWSYIRGFQPDIEGLEKFMDFGFINSILRSEYFPPADIWMAGKTINYYYFGHLVAAVLTKISNLDSAVTYNLMIATIFSLTFTAGFSLAGNFLTAISKKVIIGGLLSAVLLVLSGNLHTLWWFLTNNFNFTSYWYPDATRFIVEKFGAADNTIHEFPLYSFVVSDLHGHVSNIPFVLLFLGLLFSLFAAFGSKQAKIPQPKLTLDYVLCSMFHREAASFAYVLPLSLSLAVMYMTNSWDFPIYFLVLGVSILWLNYQSYGLTLQTLSRTFLFSIFCFLFSIFFSLPFHLHFSQIAQGLAFVHSRSPFWQLLVLWGYQWVIAAGFLIFLALRKILNTKYKIPASPSQGGQNTDTFILILLSIATLLVVLPEIVYVKDIYIDSYHRANTMFKLVYQSFMLYALASGYILIRLWVGIMNRWVKSLFLVLCSLFFVFPVIYPYFAIKSYYRDLQDYRGLDGLTFLKQTSPDDFAAILWLKQHLTGQPVVLEAVGDSYTDYNRVSMSTGFPTVQGWLVHEWLWRGGFDEPGKRATDVETIFTSKDLQQTQTLLNKYQVQYLFLGSKEGAKYQVFENKFKVLGEVVFVSGNTKIYLLDKVNNL